MRKAFLLSSLLLSFFLFLGLIFVSSPYRELRPYPLFGEKIPEKTGQTIKKVNDRIAVLINGNTETESFFIDQTPVTIRDYKKCIHSGLCETQHYRNIYTQFWNNKIYEIFPVTFVTWMEARNYCNVYGGDLPTAVQWELAAGSEYKNDYPWGNSFPNISTANIDGYYQWLTPAGWLPKGASPYGILDLTGNVREWVLDEIFADNDNKLLKGGGDHDSFPDGRVEASFNHGPTSSGFNRGFRCIYPK